MSFSRPTPQQLRDRLASEFTVALPGSDPRSRRSVEGALVRATALGLYDLYGYLDWISRQINVVSCDDDQVLALHASLWGLTPALAAAASGLVAVTGTPLAVLPAGSSMQRADGTLYASAADIHLNTTGNGSGRVVASTAGSVGNAAVGSGLTLLSPVRGIQGGLLVAADADGNGLSGGTDAETTASLRARVLQRIQQPPQGGAVADYHQWAMAVPGVTRAWVLPGWLGPGTVGVTFCTDNAPYGPAPATADVAAVAAAIDAKRPVTAAVTVFAPSLVPVNLTLAIAPDTSAVRAAVTAAFADFVTREARPGGTLYLSRLWAALSAANGEWRHRLTVPSADLVIAAGHLAVPGTITWTVYS
jgi:uncharacterized phage protein gp47/JayE